MPDYLFTIFAGVGSLLSILTAFVGYKSPKGPWITIILSGWVFSTNFLYFIDSIIWSGNNPEEWWDGKIYCDINSRIKSGFQIGVPAAAIGVTRFLATTTNQHLSQTDDNNIFKNNIIDLFIGFILPIAIVGLKYIVSPARYWIFGVSGCIGVTDTSWPSILIMFIWPPLLSVIASVYAGIFLWRWWPIRKRLSRDWTLDMPDGISLTEFLRILITVTTIIVFYLPISIFNFVRLISLPRIPYSWERIHGPHWATIVKFQMPTAQWEVWIPPLVAINLFCLMGITKTAIHLFECCIEWIYDASSLMIQEKMSWMAKISAKCKQSRLAAVNNLELQ